MTISSPLQSSNPSPGLRTQAQEVNVSPPLRPIVTSSHHRARKDHRKALTGKTPGSLPEQLVGPSPIVSVQVEGTYTRELLDTWAQVTLLYRDFYDKYLKHIPLCKLEELEICGIGTDKCPYDGYILIKIAFGPAAAAKVEAFDTLAGVCHRPLGAEQNSILIGTNIDLVRRLLSSVIGQDGSVTNGITLNCFRHVNV